MLNEFRPAGGALKAIGATLSAAVLTLAIPASVQAAAGKFQFVFGQVSVVGADGVERPVRRGSEVEEGDVITTQSRGSAQLRMADGAALAVRPSSQVRIDAYQFNNDAANDRSFLSLLRGTLRSITGLVGRNNRQGYRVATATATIGIRGSDADIGFNPTSGLTAVRTYTGGHSLTAPDANGVLTTVDTNPGQIAIASPGQAPAFTNTFPFSTPTPRSAGAQAQGGQQGQGQRQGQGQGQQDQQIAGPDSGAADRQDVRNSGTEGPNRRLGRTPLPRGNFELSAPRTAPQGTAVAGAVLFNAAVPSADAGVTAQSANTSILLNGINQPVAVVNNDIQFFRNQAPTVGPAKNFVVRNANGNVVSQGNWGAYKSGFTLIDQGVQRNGISNFHFAAATNQSSISTVQALGGTGFSANLYNFAGNMNFSDERRKFAINQQVVLAGSGSGIVSLNVDADFDDGKMFRMVGSDNIGKFVTDGISLSAGGGDNVGATGNAGGRFVGPNAQGVIISVGVRKVSNGKGFAGTAVGIRNN